MASCTGSVGGQCYTILMKVVVTPVASGTCSQDATTNATRGSMSRRHSQGLSPEPRISICSAMVCNRVEESPSAEDIKTILEARLAISKEVRRLVQVSC